MISGVGTDIIEIERISVAVNRTKNFIDKAFTQSEKNYINLKKNNPQTIAGMFAAKEATSKALGVGFLKFGLQDIEIYYDTLGKPSITLNNEAKNIALKNDIYDIQISISHCKTYAVAFAIAQKID
ncbi:MAG: holo-[acyl-carrier-protein] synthase [Epulopiscium sp. Nele67-Bin004]|nr:MAG: holo-[acyl-carrier-protein] synthase [Epulopiscium sp. Nele67-Bin004]